MKHRPKRPARAAVSKAEAVEPKGAADGVCSMQVRSAQIDMSWDSPSLVSLYLRNFAGGCTAAQQVPVNSFEHLTGNSISVDPGSNPGSLGKLDAAADKQKRISRRTSELERSQPSAAVRPKRAVGGFLVGTKKEEKQNFRVQFLHTNTHN